MKRLVQHVDQIAVMTYDYNDDHLIGPLAPFPWVSTVMKRLLEAVPEDPERLLLGLNFYGQDHVGEFGTKMSEAPRAVVAHDYIKVGS